jgi:murein tripeptide amidase MpaA
MQIDSDFEGGSIEILDASDPSSIELALDHDNAADIRQWFFFRVTKAKGTPCVMRIVNAGESLYPGGWDGYRACASYDGEVWRRVPTRYRDGVLTIRHKPRRDVVTYAYFPYYSSDRREALIALARSSRRASVVELGRSVEGRPMRVIVVGDQGRPLRRIWVIAHQHPGETMAAWFMEGMVSRLLDEADRAAAALRRKAVVYLVPSMNPDGCARGNHRTNAAGRDLNREWLYPSMEASPEVFLVREAMVDGGVDLFVDVHGEEAIPYVFAFGAEGIPEYSDRLAGLEHLFTSTLARIDGDFQRKRGYDRDAPGQADLRLASSYVAQRFDCLAQGLEMPFKDNANREDKTTGWSPDRSRAFGRSVVETLLACVDSVR